MSHTFYTLAKKGQAMDSQTLAARQLAEAFRRNGYVRLQNPGRVKEGRKVYRKGDEVRLVVSSKEELQRLRALLETAGFKPGKPYAQGRQYRQPAYGHQQVALFLTTQRVR